MRVSCLSDHSEDVSIYLFILFSQVICRIMYNWPNVHHKTVHYINSQIQSNYCSSY